MKPFIPLEKRSKKEQRAYHQAKRGSWNGVKPVTRVIPNKKRYDRKKKLRWEGYPGAVFFYLWEELINLPVFFTERRLQSSEKEVK